MLIQTHEICPQCDQRIYMRCHPKLNSDGTMIFSRSGDEGVPHAIADGCYLDREGVLCIVNFDAETREPDYFCLHCAWSVD